MRHRPGVVDGTRTQATGTTVGCRWTRLSCSPTDVSSLGSGGGHIIGPRQYRSALLFVRTVAGVASHHGLLHVATVDYNEFYFAVRRALLRYRRKEGECWIWTRGVNGRGYGRYYVPPNYGRFKVHRLSAYLWLGLDLEDSSVHLHHTCENPRCFNPHHLVFTSLEKHSTLHRQIRQSKQCR
jgi:hypothetical protein